MKFAIQEKVEEMLWGYDRILSHFFNSDSASDQEIWDNVRSIENINEVDAEGMALSLTFEKLDKAIVNSPLAGAIPFLSDKIEYTVAGQASRFLIDKEQVRDANEFTSVMNGLLLKYVVTERLDECLAAFKFLHDEPRSSAIDFLYTHRDEFDPELAQEIEQLAGENAKDHVVIFGSTSQGMAQFPN